MQADSLNLSKGDIAGGKIASVSGTIVLRSIMGPVMDVFGARKGMFVLMAVCTPGVIGMIFTTNATGFIICRCLIGFSLATFVCSQTWCAQMFSRRIIGVANATAAGWGNLGGGVTNLLMPYFFLAFMEATGKDEDLSWRLSYLIPLLMHILSMILSWSSQDLPDGNYGQLENSGVKQKSKGSAVLKIGLSNVNAWILTLTYGMCFGVELTMNSVAALYFHEYHGLTPQIAGLLASFYGLMNLVARSAGGLLSDWSNKRAGMRGRLWSCWIVQTLEGALCCCMAAVTLGADSPFERPDVNAWIKESDLPAGTFTGTHTHEGSTLVENSGMDGYVHQDGWVMIPEYLKDGVKTNYTVTECGCDQGALPEPIQKLWGLDDKLYMVFEPPFARDGAAADCIQHQNLAGLGVLCMILFSICVQAAEGLHYGIVPYVSRPALGIVSGMVGAGGNLGSVIALSAFFRGKTTRTDTGFMNLGIMVMAITGLMFLIYFPDMGSMLTGPGGMGKYDPQLVKPPADYRGADSMDFGAVKTDADGKEKAATVEQAQA